MALHHREDSPQTSPAFGLKHRPGGGDYNGYVARLVLLAATFGVGYLLNYLSGGRPYFGFLAVSGVILVCIGLVLGPRMQVRSARVAVPLFDLAWITFAMYLTNGLGSVLLPLLYIVVAMAAMRGGHWEIGTSLAGAITAIFILASTKHTGPSLTLAVAQATLLAAGALAVRLTVNEASSEGKEDGNARLYETLLQKTSDAVFALAPDTWQVLEANPAARALCGDGSDGPVEGEPLDHLVGFQDKAFAKTCRKALAEGLPVVDAITHATGPDGHKLLLRCNMTPVHPEGDGESIQTIIQVVEEAELQPAPTPVRDDFSLNYIPSLTHELNNHLAAIRLGAELAATTGRAPDFNEIQRQVDRCQEVLQTVVVQILRSSRPAAMPETPPQADLALAIERVLLLTRPHILTNGVQLQVEIADYLPPVLGFMHEVQEALVRVIIESVQRMARHDGPRALTLTVTPRRNSVEVLITDASPGLNTRELALISGRAVAVSRAEDRTWEIVRDAICRFGGEVHADNGLNGGMRLRLSLPICDEQQVVA